MSRRCWQTTTHSPTHIASGAALVNVNPKAVLAHIISPLACPGPIYRLSHAFAPLPFPWEPFCTLNSSQLAHDPGWRTQVQSPRCQHTYTGRRFLFCHDHSHCDEKKSQAT